MIYKIITRLKAKSKKDLEQNLPGLAAGAAGLAAEVDGLAAGGAGTTAGFDAIIQ